MLDLMDIEEIKNDIKYLSLQYETAVKTLFKYDNNEITLESAQTVILSLNNYESSEDLSLETATDEKTFINKILDFIKKIFITIKNAVITFFKKIRLLYLNVTKQAYKIETEINQGHFELSDSLIKDLRTLFFSFNVSKNIQPIDNFINYLGKILNLYRMNNIKLNNVGDIYIFKFTRDGIETEFCNSILDICKGNAFLISLENNDLYKVSGQKILSVIGYNIKNKTIDAIVEMDNNKKIIKLPINNPSRNNIIPHDSIDINISNIGRIINLIGHSEGEFEALENRVNFYLKDMEKELTAEIEHGLKKNRSHLKLDLKDYNMYINHSDVLINKLSNLILESISHLSTFTYRIVDTIEKGKKYKEEEK